MKISGIELLKLLRRVHLGGIIEEAVIDFGGGTIQAVDMTSSLMVNCKGDVSMEFGEMGLGDLSLLSRYLASVTGDIAFTKKDNRLIIESGIGTLSYLTKDISFITTAIEAGDVSKLMEPCVCKVVFSEDACKEYLMYAGLVKSQRLQFTVGAGQVSLHCGLESEHRFDMLVGKAVSLGAKKKAIPEFSVDVYSQHFSAICSVLEWGEPYIMMAPEHPIIVKQNDDNFWAMLPLGDSGAATGE
jgi:hypothetical protein